jgi:hypothetical protein
MSRLFRATAIALTVVGLATVGIQPAASLPATGKSIAINFDTVHAPCLFKNTFALRNEYGALGIVFLGPAQLDGGGLINQCSVFGVTGYSPPNFLGFNPLNAAFHDGGIPRGPERILFKTAMSHVEVKVAHGNTYEGSAIMTAFDSHGVVLDTVTLTLSNTLTPFSIDAQGIKSVVVNSDAAQWVLDDLVAT